MYGVRAIFRMRFLGEGILSLAWGEESGRPESRAAEGDIGPKDDELCDECGEREKESAPPPPPPPPKGLLGPVLWCVLVLVEVEEAEERIDASSETDAE